FFVFCLGRLQNWNIRISILPKSEEILISRSCFRRVNLNSVGATHSEPSQGIERTSWIDAAVIKNFLILGSCLHTISRFQKGFAANVNGPVNRAARRAAQFVGRG